ncbi:RpiR family transcriptional regulator [Sporosarcina sp. NCCP-2716]|uniref:MurR/RpiR family transcriptional regulator n=1 Tax=Sporosarcina sp. NCCP-2716 TaxID=2943679 RepID=UPI00203A3B39|nr:MurR/RpiR family transcriptional regulator [Sporosarcina sp. NCCP-2716]GKV70485.1 RpiR family transcriptional regulator [Sporosarcina sp. NCCP-2716]
MDFKNRLQKYSAAFTDNDRKIAGYLLEDKQVAQKSITDLAGEIDVSPSSITRFCKRMQFDSFQQLKYALMDASADRRMNDGEIMHVTDLYESIIHSTQQFLEIGQISRIAEQLRLARRVLFCGVGNSGLIAREFNSRVERMGMDSAAVTDAHTMVMRSALLSEADVLMCFSYTGKTQSVLSAARQAKENGARLIVVTTSGAEELTDLADDIVFVADHALAEDEKFINTQLSSLFFLDVLTYRLLENPELRANRAKTLAALKRFG